MGGISPSAAKYIINASCEVDGMIDKSDVIGAIFGQTEGLFNEEYDFRALLEKGRIGRIVVDLDVKDNKSYGKIMIPSNLDKAETALIASIVENVDRIGPYTARITLDGIEDTRMEKVNKVIVRAKEILENWERKQEKVDVREMLQSLLGKVREAALIEYGPEKLDAGPEVDESDSVILVEGRADVLNLLRYGYKNAISLGGAAERVPKTIIELCKTKETCVFLDGDRGGDLILKRLLEVAEIDFVARAPQGKEVEELTGKEIMKSLMSKVPVSQHVQTEKPPRESQHQEPRPTTVQQVQQAQAVQQVVQKQRPPVPEKIAAYVKDLYGTLEAVVLDQSLNEIARLSVKEMADKLQELSGKNPYAVVFDGVISQRILDTAGDISVQYLIGNRLGNVVRRPAGVVTLTFEDVSP
ncbi:MAG: DNA primase DnaG [Candidatus Marsarchaeota archaeon]|nr:DNA primase DnaG [Candidatus Marsarchaeota archaeon]